MRLLGEGQVYVGYTLVGFHVIFARKPSSSGELTSARYRMQLCVCIYFCVNVCVRMYVCIRLHVQYVVVCV